MGVPCQSTCTPWATEADLCSPCDEAGYSWDPVLLDDCLQAASDVLFHLSGRQYPGSCSDTVRPCRHAANTPPRRRSHTTGRGCGCGRRVSEVTLGVYPLTSITAVKVDGVTLDSSRYRIDNFRTLVRLADADGSNPGWPCCQDVTLPDTETGTWSVTFIYGTPPPIGGVRAAAALACQLALACQPETIGECRLPQRVTSVARQGVDMVVLDPLELFTEGRTGLPEVDLWLAAVNPAAVRSRATVASPDRRRRVRRVGT